MDAKDGKPAKAKAPVVTNNGGCILSINGVDIAPKASEEVPGFDAKKPVIKAWLDAKVISVE